MFDSSYSDIEIATTSFTVAGVVVPEDEDQTHLLVAVGVETAGAITATITVGGGSFGFSSVTDSGLTGGLQLLVWQAIRPPPGTYTITVALSSAKTGCIAAVVSKKVFLHNPASNTTGSAVSSGTATNATAIAAGRGSVLMDFLVTTNTGSGPTLTPNANQTQAVNTGNAAGSGVKLGVSYRPSTSNHIVLGWTWTGGSYNAYHFVVSVVEDAPPKLSQLVELETASKYSAPPDPDAILPIVYGDLSQQTLTGAIPAVCISSNRLTWLAANHVTQAITRVYVDNEDVTGSVTVSTSHNFESLGSVSTITFGTAPNGTVSWDGKGIVESSALIENPIRQLEHFLKTYAGLSDVDFELHSISESKYRSDSIGYVTAFVFAERRTLQDWLTQTLFEALGYWNVTGDGRLSIHVDSGGAVDQGGLVANIVAARDVMDGDDGVTMTWDYRHLINALSAEYLWSWAYGKAASRDTANSDATSVNAMGRVAKTVTLKGARTTAQVAAWAVVLFSRQSLRSRYEGAILQFGVHNRRLLIAKPGDFVGLSWFHGPYEAPVGGTSIAYTNRILKILSLEHDLSEGGVTKVTALDTGSYLVEDGGVYFNGAVYYDGAVYYNEADQLTEYLPF